MKTRILTFISAVTLFSVLSIPVRLTPMAQADEQHHRHYKVIDLGTFGGPNSYSNLMSTVGEAKVIAVGQADTSDSVFPNTNPYNCFDPYVMNAFKWEDGVRVNLHSLNDDENCSEASGISASGIFVGDSENGAVDPLTGFKELRAVVWKYGKIMGLGTFGGNHSAALSINDRGQTIGWALNDIPDPYSLFDLPILSSSNGTQTRAFLWQDGEMQDLRTLGGPDAEPFFINNRGSIAGFSYTNSTPNPVTGLPTLHPFLWHKGEMKDLGTLGGFGTPFSTVSVNGLNNRGQVIGLSPLAGDQMADPFLWDRARLIDLATQGTGGTFLSANALNDAGEIVGVAAFPGRVFDASLWRDGVVTDLGTVGADGCSEAHALNSEGQIVGKSESCDFSTARAFLWENGSMIDLNTVVPPGTLLRLGEANFINDQGVIAGQGGLPNGDQHSFLLIPVCEDDTEGCADASVDQRAMIHSGAAPDTQAQPTRAVLGPTAVTPGSPAAREMMARIHAGPTRRFQVPGLATPRAR